MKHVALCLLFVCVLCTTTVANEISEQDQVDSFFREKLVLCEIAFLSDSYSLSKQAKAVLDDIVVQLEKIDTNSKTIRIEGFLGTQDTVSEPIRLAMSRAIAVEDYLRSHHAVSFERFLTGHKDFRSDCHVEIVLYDNPWQSDETPIQIASKEK